MGLASVHHHPDDERCTYEHHSQHREAGDGRQLPHVRRLLHRFACSLDNKAAVQLRSWAPSSASSESLSVSYMCCRRASWGTSCTMSTARKHPSQSSRTPSGCTDLDTGRQTPSLTNTTKCSTPRGLQTSVFVLASVGKRKETLLLTKVTLFLGFFLAMMCHRNGEKRWFNVPHFRECEIKVSCIKWTTFISPSTSMTTFPSTQG